MKVTHFVTLLTLTATAAARAVPVDSTAVQHISEVVVTGSNNPVEQRLLPYTVSVIGPRELEAAGSTQVLSILSDRVPSLFVTERGILGFGVSSNGGAGHIKLRGVGGDRASGVLMMMDGQPQYAGIYSHHVADFYNKEYVERVEVLRGPGSVLYGSNAMAGVINVITKQARRDGVHASLSTEYGSYNTSLTSASATARYGRLSAMVNGSFDRTDGNIKGMDFREWSAYAKVGYDISRHWKSAADYTFMNFVGDDPVYPRLSDPESTAVYHQNIIRGEASVSASNVYDRTNGVVRAYYSYGNHIIDDPRRFRSTDDRFGVLAYQNFSPAPMTDVTLGFDFDIYSGEIPTSGGTAHQPGAMATIGHKQIKEYSPYVAVSQGFLGRTITVNGGLRMANSDRFSTRWVPQAGFSVTPASLFTLKGSAAMGYRNPSFRELYLYRMANPDLEPERMWNYELSLSRSFGTSFDASLTAYYSRGTNMIQVLDMKNVNTGKFINKGIEVTAGWRPSRTVSLNASYSWLHTSLRNLTGAPRQQYWLGAEWTGVPRLTLSGELKGVAALYVADGIDRQSYALLNVKAQYSLTRHVRLMLRADNITDARYVINRGYEMPGFTAMGGVSLHF